MKRHSFDKIILKVRSETIIRVATNQNREGIVRAKESQKDTRNIIHRELSSETRKIHVSRKRY